MAEINITAVYSDMLKCAQILEDIGADVKIAYTDLNDFLTKKMVFNGKQIYANWQSDARAVFEEKSKVIVDIFSKVQTECYEASNTLKAVIKEYESRDSTIASQTMVLKSNPKTIVTLDFKQFGNINTVLKDGKAPIIAIPNIIPAGSELFKTKKLEDILKEHTNKGKSVIKVEFNPVVTPCTKVQRVK